MSLADEFAAADRRRAEQLGQVRQIRADVERLARRIEGICQTTEQMRALATYQRPIREGGTTRYDASSGARLAAAVRRRMGLEER